jgi:ribonucleoside-diphosphate reductase alpha chain
MFKYVVKWGVRFLDNINDISNAPLPEYKKSMTEKRRIGFGVMGLGSLHFMLGMRYGSAEALNVIEKLYKLKAETEILTSATLGALKGSFELFDKEKYFSSYWWKNLKIDSKVKEQVEFIGEMRNSHRSMNAPTGNTAILALVVSGGIEPVFMREYIRWAIVPESERYRLKRKGLKLPDVYRGEWFETEHFKFVQKGDEEILKGTFEDVEYEIDKNRGLVKATLVEDFGWRWVKEHFPIEKVKELSDKNIFATTEELNVEEHIKVLEIISAYTDQNNSKTVNLPTDYSYDEFKKLYFTAWQSNIKGLTTYRAGTMTAVLEKVEKYQNELDELFAKSNGNIILDGVKLPREYNSKGYIIRDNHSKKWYVHIAFADSKYRKPFALFVNSNHKETTDVADEVIQTIEELIRSKGIKEELIEKQRIKYAGQPNTVKIARAFGMALRHNIPTIELVETLDKFDVEFSSFVYHLKKLIAKFIKDGTNVKGEECPSCNRKTSIVYQEGCKICKHCGYSAC